MKRRLPRCEFQHKGRSPLATVYGGFSGAGDWAGYACASCARTRGFSIWDRLDSRGKVIHTTGSQCDQEVG